MAGGQLWGVWVQPITGDTTQANVEKYGEVEDMAQAYRDGFAKEFCDGQTSPTPPRWPDDGMQLLYFYDEESARLVSDYLRGSLQDRFTAGEMPGGMAPSWVQTALDAVLAATNTPSINEEVDRMLESMERIRDVVPEDVHGLDWMENLASLDSKGWQILGYAKEFPNVYLEVISPDGTYGVSALRTLIAIDNGSLESSRPSILPGTDRASKMVWQSLRSIFRRYGHDLR